ncbi:hypothetical protein [Limobrevibacterium gyesilva]|uniref:Uncharacterized protein n=1 Tax=Limobrevibacterium gyesilva TaxID=2991712 RepID=A0AA41YNZ0_9PROT|nr:hypothetical protein [Limobrevibacterium gyesilva]MCW3477396.1 hypothetical protein [Limobrevibacterium gyesilva]
MPDPIGTLQGVPPYYADQADSGTWSVKDQLGAIAWRGEDGRAGLIGRDDAEMIIRSHGHTPGPARPSQAYGLAHGKPKRAKKAKTAAR